MQHSIHNKQPVLWSFWASDIKREKEQEKCFHSFQTHPLKVTFRMHRYLELAAVCFYTFIRKQTTISARIKLFFFIYKTKIMFVAPESHCSCWMKCRGFLVFITWFQRLMETRTSIGGTTPMKWVLHSVPCFPVYTSSHISPHPKPVTEQNPNQDLMKNWRLLWQQHQYLSVQIRSFS